MKQPKIPTYRVKLRGRKPWYRPRKKKRPEDREWYKTIRRLDCYEGIYERLCLNYKLTAVADWVQQEQGEATHIKRESLVKMLAGLRQQIPDADLLGARPLSVDHTRAVERMKEGLNVLEELEKLYRIQTARIAIDVKNEQNINKLMKGLTGEMKEARELLQAYHQVQADLGLIEKHLGKLQVENTTTNVSLSAHLEGRTDAEGAAEALDAVTSKPKNVNNVLNVFEKVLALSAMDDEELEEAIDITPDEDGFVEDDDV